MSRLEAIRTLLEQDPGNSRVRYMMCMEYLSAEDWAGGAVALSELIERDPSYVAAYYQAGRAAERLDEIEKARDFYSRGIAAARQAGDGHALSELQAALDVLG